MNLAAVPALEAGAPRASAPSAAPGVASDAVRRPRFRSRWPRPPTSSPWSSASTSTRCTSTRSWPTGARSSSRRPTGPSRSRCPRPPSPARRSRSASRSLEGEYVALGTSDGRVSLQQVRFTPRYEDQKLVDLDLAVRDRGLVELDPARARAARGGLRGERRAQERGRRGGRRRGAGLAHRRRGRRAPGHPADEGWREDHPRAHRAQRHPHRLHREGQPLPLGARPRRCGSPRWPTSPTSPSPLSSTSWAASPPSWATPRATSAAGSAFASRKRTPSSSS